MSRIADLSELLGSDQLTQSKLADETGVILDLDSLQVLTLNETGMFLVEELGAGARSRDELIARLVAEFEVDEETAADDVDAFVEQLAHELLERRKR